MKKRITIMLDDDNMKISVRHMLRMVEFLLDPQ